MSEWKEYRLDECTEIKNGKSRPKNIGIVPVYGGNGIFDYCNNSNVSGQTIIIGRVGAYCGSVYFENNEIWVSDNALFAKSKPGFDSKYLYYLLTHDNLNQYAGGSSHPLLTQSRLNELKYSIPNFRTQTAIAEILSSLDDKIELNNKINQELENLAQTLFKQWFIDFEFPNENGEPYKSSGGEMVDSELGEIPKGWEVYRFKEIVSKYIDNRGKTPPIANDGIPLVEVRQMVDTGIYPSLRTDKFLSKEVYDTFLRGHLLKDDILMSTVGTIGRLNIVPDFQIFAIAQNVLGIRFNKDLTSQLFMFCLMRTKDFNDEINSRLIETVQSSIKRSDLEKIPVILPKLILVERFDSLIRDIFDRIKNSALEIEELTNLRDILLSKLISGELHVTSKKTNTNYKLS
jgi:type I restriction enzyme S subunit